jgi:ubiquinone/menaquinone biosynthesis C-methylase UbiE
MDMGEWERHRPHWDDFSLDYDRIFMEEPLYLDTIRLIVGMLRDAGGGEVLELGCGTGNIISAMLEGVPGASITGVDPSAGMRARCAEKFSGNPQVDIADGEALAIPFRDGSFDVVTSNYTLHHVPPGERGACAAELARVLKPGGRLIYSDMFSGVDAPQHDAARIGDLIDRYVAQAIYDFEHGAFEMMKLKLKVLSRSVLAQGEYHTTVEEWARHLEKAGFTGIEVTDIPPGDFGLRIITASR